MKNMKELDEGLLTEVTGGAQNTNNTESAVRSVCIEVAEKNNRNRRSIECRPDSTAFSHP